MRDTQIHSDVIQDVVNVFDFRTHEHLTRHCDNENLQFGSLQKNPLVVCKLFGNEQTKASFTQMAKIGEPDVEMAETQNETSTVGEVKTVSLTEFMQEKLNAIDGGIANVLDVITGNKQKENQLERLVYGLVGFTSGILFGMILMRKK